MNPMPDQPGKPHDPPCESRAPIEADTVEIEALLRRINFVMNRRGRAVLADFDLTPPQFFALSHIHHHPGLVMTELCQKLNLANPTVTGLVDRLEQKGLVERVRDKEDRRTVRLNTTALGEKLLAESLHARQQSLANDIAGFTREERQQLVNLLRHLMEAMSTSN